MDMELLIKNTVEKNLGVCVREVSCVGKGASGSVYCALCSGKTEKIAVKISSHPELMQKEFEMLELLGEKTQSKIPKVYFFDTVAETAILAMEFIEGVSGTDKSLPFSFGKKHLAESIVNNLLVIQKAKNDKFGPYDNAVYDTWQEYYKLFCR